VKHNLAPEALVDLTLAGRALRRRHAHCDAHGANPAQGVATLVASPDVLDAMKGRARVANDDDKEEAKNGEEEAERSAANATLAQLVVRCGVAHEGATVADASRLLDVFQCNNFGISTELLKPVASGVFPYTALLNHSCEPSCVLTYDPEVPTRVVIRACRPISAGDELTHSYIDVAATSASRRQRLLQTYGFWCSCALCEMGAAGTPSAPIPDAELSGVARGVDGATAEALGKAARLKSHAAELTDLSQERQCVEDAFAIERWVLAPLNTELHATSQLAFSLSVAVGDYDAAIRHGEHVLESLKCYYHRNHPQTGIHLYVLADIHAELARAYACAKDLDAAAGRREDAIKLWLQAASVLTVTHGAAHPLVQRCRAAAAHFNGSQSLS
jgi:SET and MYND domain-containing protein